MATGPIRKIAFAATGSATPTLPALGSNITWATPWLTTVGGQPGTSDDLQLGADAVEMTMREETIEDDPPVAQSREGEWITKNQLDMVTFSVHGAEKAIDGLSSTAVTTSNEVEEGVSITYRAMCVEVAGVKIYYMPKVRVKVIKPSLPVTGGVATATVECKVFGTSSYPAGFSALEFNG